MSESCLPLLREIKRLNKEIYYFKSRELQFKKFEDERKEIQSFIDRIRLFSVIIMQQYNIDVSIFI